MRYLILLPLLLAACGSKESTPRDRAEAHCRHELDEQPRLPKNAGEEALAAEKAGDKDFNRICLQRAGYKD